VLANGKRITVREDIPEVVRRVIEYQRKIRTGLGPRIGGTADPE
jgi:uncharacterized protein YlzI (FlbEa/FlbD family)